VKEGKGLLAPFWDTGDELASTCLDHGVDNGFRVSWHGSTLLQNQPVFNYLLTTMC
jgi:hypothetical protein